ncbi:hypothetical protein GQ457_11G024900 [Hibiscus cannabinus]
MSAIIKLLKHWDILGQDVIKLCHKLLSGRTDMYAVNNTVIALIPKVEEPVRMKQLRPISLCTVIYKIVSKTLLNRMKPYLHLCISENQSAFLKGRLISDNILIAHKLIHYLSSSKNGPNKGRLLNKIWRRHSIESSGPSSGVSCYGPRVNHLFYADDSVVFVRNSVQEVSRLKEVLNIFAASSGQRINFDKSTIFFSPNTPTAHRRQISSVLGVSEVFDPGIYLGVPLKIGKNKTDAFGFVNETVDKRIDGWTKRLLSFGGMEIFLKSVAQALPQYIMSCYLLPRTVTDRVTSSMHRFWWKGKANKRGWPLMAWDRIYSPKNAGGLGLRDLRCFNLDLLGKQH